MTSITFDITGLPELKMASVRVRKQVERNLRMAILSAANDIKKTMTDSILSGNKTGKTYRRGGVTHVASAAGEPPASDTGRLVSSIGVFPDLSGLSIDIGVKRPMVNYALFLEFGTSKMDARPFIAPAGLKNRAKALNKMERALLAGLASGK